MDSLVSWYNAKDKKEYHFINGTTIDLVGDILILEGSWNAYEIKR